MPTPSGRYIDTGGTDLDRTAAPVGCGTARGTTGSQPLVSPGPVSTVAGEDAVLAYIAKCRSGLAASAASRPRPRRISGSPNPTRGRVSRHASKARRLREGVEQVVLDTRMALTAEDVLAQVPYARTLGVQFGDFTSARVCGVLALTPELSTVGGGMHGGALMGLADVCAAVCATLNGPQGAVPATATSATQFMQPMRSAATAVATALHVGRASVIVEVDVTDEAGQLCVRVTQTVTVRVPSGPAPT